MQLTMNAVKCQSMKRCTQPNWCVGDIHHTHTHVARAEHRRARKKEKPGMLSKVYAQHIEDKNKWHKRVNWIFAACK